MDSNDSSVVALPSATAIATTAQKALELLRCCITEEDDDTPCPAQNQLSRFNLWSSNIGVFATHHASLDYRLRTANAARTAVQGNLEDLCEQLLFALTGEEDLEGEDLQAFATTKPQNVFKFGREMQKRYFSGREARIHLPGLAGAENIITTLHQLSLAIRSSSNRSTLTKAPKLTDIDKEFFWIRERREGPTDVGVQRLPPVSFDVAQKFEVYVREVLGRRWMTCWPKDDMPVKDKKEMEAEAILSLPQREYRQVMLDRCVSLITARRKQLAYFQGHQVKLSANVKAFQAPQVTKNFATTKSGDQLPLPGPTTSASHSALLPRLTDVNFPGLRVAHSETIGTEFLSNTPLTLLASPINSAPSMAASSMYDLGTASTNILGIPPPPELRAFEKEKPCPYCCLVYPTQIFNPERSWKWRKHLMEDLQPYPCLYKNCERSAKSYRSFKEWQAHLKTPHHQHWQCPLPHTELTAAAQCADGFDKIVDFEKHLAVHHLNLDSSMTRNAVHLAGQPTDLPKWCFVCLEAQSNEGPELLKHIERHMRQAYLLALPGRDDIRDSDDVSSGRARTGVEALDGEKFSEDSDPSEPSPLSGHTSEGLDSSKPLRQKGDFHKDQTKSENATKMTKAFEAKLLAIDSQSGPREAQSQTVLESWTTLQPDVLSDPNLPHPRLSKEWHTLLIVISAFGRHKRTRRVIPSREFQDRFSHQSYVSGPVSIGPRPRFRFRKAVLEIIAAHRERPAGFEWVVMFCSPIVLQQRWSRRWPLHRPDLAWNYVLAMVLAKVRLLRNLRYYVSARVEWRGLRRNRERYQRRWKFVLGAVLAEQQKLRYRFRIGGTVLSPREKWKVTISKILQINRLGTLLSASLTIRTQWQALHRKQTMIMDSPIYGPHEVFVNGQDQGLRKRRWTDIFRRPKLQTVPTWTHNFLPQGRLWRKVLLVVLAVVRLLRSVERTTDYYTPQVGPTSLAAFPLRSGDGASGKRPITFTTRYRPPISRYMIVRRRWRVALLVVIFSNKLLRSIEPTTRQPTEASLFSAAITARPSPLSRADTFSITNSSSTRLSRVTFGKVSPSTFLASVFKGKRKK